ncbi:hypothetical protein I3760_08G115100 [Carya illinoinensis]|nr:hypothetical protein I3760_08G115100 [Carya illinoinensis]
MAFLISGCFLLLGSSGIKVKDDSGVVYSVGAHNLSSASTKIIRRTLTSFLLLIAMLQSFLY